MYFLPTLEQAREIVRGNRQFQTQVHEVDGHRLHHFGYSLPGQRDFEDPVPGSGLRAHELRGLTFVESPDGSVRRHLMLRKFHSLDGAAGHAARDLADKPVRHCGRKLDGSLIRFIPLGGRGGPPEGLRARSMRSFAGPHVRLAESLLAGDPRLEAFVREAHAGGLAPVFELVSPAWKIVLDYPEDRLCLIQMREEATGAYLDLDGHPLVERHGIETPTVPGVRALRDLLDERAKGRDIEGWVLRYEDGSMVKVKTPWYEDMHDFVFEGRRTEKKMLEMALNGTLAEALGRLPPEDPDRGRAREVLELVPAWIDLTAARVLAGARAFEGDPSDNAARKAFTEARRGDPLLPFYMQALRDPRPETARRLAAGEVAKAGRREEDARRLVERLRAERAASAGAPGI